MGKEQSKWQSPELDEPLIEVTDSYVLNFAKYNENQCSVFSGAPSQCLTALSNNLKTHRHPNIVRHISSNSYNGRFYIVTEEVKPLLLCINELSPLQICVGIHSITEAVEFLHSQAASSHNNICCASIFVSRDGTWKLGGLEFLCKFSSMNLLKMQEMSSRRYEPAIAPEERSGPLVPAAIDIYALGMVINELLVPHITHDLPGMHSMLDFCNTKMINNDPKNRPRVEDVCKHSFFDQEFIKIHKFLSELPLRNSEEKTSFFRNLENNLKNLPEVMVATQLINLLLARIVVMEPAAQNLLPMLLRPKVEGAQDGSIFSEGVFRQYVVPKILQMVCVRDTSVRLLILTHLQSYITSFTKEQLLTQLLPELLVGIKDEDDQLVASTLHALAFMVGRLGGAAVVGGSRARLFSDGRPAVRRPRPEASLPERPSPDGGEDSVTEDTEAWSDWEQQVEKPVATETKNILIEEVIITHETKSQSNIKRPPTKTLADLDSLDIKNGGGSGREQGPDFFSDMEPVISRSVVAVIKEDADKFGVSDMAAADTAGAAWESFEEWE